MNYLLSKIKIYLAKFIIFLLALVTMFNNAYAQIDCNTDPNCLDPDLPVPLDTNLIILITLAIIFSFYTLHKNIKHQQVLHTY